jgi:hypothetical protein
MSHSKEDITHRSFTSREKGSDLSIGTYVKVHILK